MNVEKIKDFVTKQIEEYRLEIYVCTDESKESALLTVVNTYQSVLNFIEGKV
jgi:predicted RNase H-related nuclease YkuK (DUF458 family)